MINIKDEQDYKSPWNFLKGEFLQKQRGWGITKVYSHERGNVASFEKKLTFRCMNQKFKEVLVYYHCFIDAFEPHYGSGKQEGDCKVQFFVGFETGKILQSFDPLNIDTLQNQEIQNYYEEMNRFLKGFVRKYKLVVEYNLKPKVGIVGGYWRRFTTVDEFRSANMLVGLEEFFHHLHKIGLNRSKYQPRRRNNPSRL